jgi:predicted permease
MITGFRDNVRLTLRSLRRNPVFVVVSVLSLALGIGLNTAIFSVIHTLTLRPLPVTGPERLVSIFHRHDSGYLSSNSYQDYVFFQEHTEVFSGVAAYMRTQLFLDAGEAPERVAGELVSPGYFQLLGVEPALGRTFRATQRGGGIEADEEGAVAILSHGYWMRRFGGDPEVAGRTVSFGGHPFTIVGVAAREYEGLTLDQGRPPEVWVPITTYREAVPAMAAFDFLESWGAHTFNVVARLGHGVSLDQARAAMEVVGDRAGALREGSTGEENRFTPVLYRTVEARLRPGQRETVHRFLALLGTVAGLVLLLACFNVANLMVARAAKRRREMAVRLSLGAGKGRVALHLLAESLLLSLAGGAVGLLVALWAGAYLAGFHNPFGIPLALASGLELGVLGFALAVSLATGLLVGLLPLRQAFRLDLSTLMKEDPVGASRVAAGLSARDLLVMAQVSLSLILLVGGGLFLRTLHHAQAEDVVVQPENVLLVRLNLLEAGYEPHRSGEIHTQALARVESLPGVQSASLVQTVPMGGSRGARDIFAETPAAPGQEVPMNMEFNVISPDYFRTVGIPVVRGRPFSGLDREGSPPVAIVNDRMAESLWPGEEPLGRTFRVRGHEVGPVEVVGVVRDGKFRNYRAPLAPGFYLPFAQSPSPMMSLQVRVEGNAMALAPLVRGAVQEVNRTIPRPEIMTMKAYRNINLSQERLLAQMLGAFGLLALVLALLGVYGVISYTVGERTREIGIRMALGAEGGIITAMVLRRGFLLALAGLAVGMVVALMLTRFVTTLLYGVEATDPPTFVAVAVTLLGTALLASWIPSRRAAAVDPAVALSGR